MVSREDVEKQLQSCDPTRPEVWLSDGWWEGVRWQYKQAYEVCAWSHFLLSLEPQTRKLASKYRSEPKSFRSALERAMCRQAKKLGIPWEKNGQPETLSLPDGLSQRQLTVLSDAVPLMQTLLCGGPELAGSLNPNTRQILSFVRAFAVQRGGRKKNSFYDQALQMFLDGKSTNVICQTLYAKYGSRSEKDRKKLRNSMRSAINRRLQEALSSRSVRKHPL
jgi:hypothetical protein